MDQSITTFAGIDVAKDSLEVCQQPGNRKLTETNDDKGHKRVLRWLPKPGACLIVVEATGGYERRLVDALLKKGHLVAVANPTQVRDFARGLGILAKTDGVDAAVLAQYAEIARPRTTALAPENRVELTELVTRRRQLIDQRTAERNRLGQARVKAVRVNVQQTIRFLQKQIDSIEKRIKELLKSDDDWNDKADLLMSVPGIGPITVAALLADLPELGQLNRQQVAALAGLAPYNRDSGRSQGKRSIFGGRKAVRSSLYMATLSAMSYNDAIKEFAMRLKEQNKPFKVVITACMRKLLVILNAILKSDTPWEPRNV